MHTLTSSFKNNFNFEFKNSNFSSVHYITFDVSQSDWGRVYGETHASRFIEVAVFEFEIEVVLKGAR